jgi:hypothetical protein
MPPSWSAGAVAAALTWPFASVGVDTYCPWLCSIVLLDCFLGGFGNIDRRWNPPQWYNVLLAFLESIELHIVLAF